MISPQALFFFALFKSFVGEIIFKSVIQITISCGRVEGKSQDSPLGYSFLSTLYVYFAHKI